MLTYHPALWAPLLPEGGEFWILLTFQSTSFEILPTFSQSHRKEKTLKKQSKPGHDKVIALNQFRRLETIVSAKRNHSFKGLKLQFQQLGIISFKRLELWFQAFGTLVSNCKTNCFKVQKRQLHTVMKSTTSKHIPTNTRVTA